MKPKQLPQDGSTARYETSAMLAPRRRGALVGGVTGDGRTDTPFPLVFERAVGSRLFDADGHSYVDLHGGYGTAILGYGDPVVDGAVIQAISDGRAFVGVANAYEMELAERLCDLLPEADRVALCGGGGTDALYHALRIARTYTGRSKVIKVEGGYHGWHGDLGASTRPSRDTFGADQLPRTVPNSTGILPAVTDAIAVVPANDIEALRARVARIGTDLAAIVVEPVLYSVGTVAVDAAYLREAAALSKAWGAVLIFDEVLSGFRVRLGGAAQEAGVVPDLAAYGKAIANGYVLAALAGAEALMEQLAPVGSAFYSGTFNGHPLSVAAAMATLDRVSEPGFYERVTAATQRVSTAISEAIQTDDLNVVCQSVGTCFTLYLGTREVRGYRDLDRSLTPQIEALNDTFRWTLRDQGVFMQRRSGTNRCFISAAHSDLDLEHIITAIADFLHDHREELAR